MPHTTSATVRPLDIVQILRVHWVRWVVPTVAIGLLSGTYAAFRSPTWEASQALMVRDEAFGGLTRPGKFTHTDEMKASQETVLELVKSRGVISQALAHACGQFGAVGAADAPAEKDVEALQNNIKLTPPKGAEFGKTEVFYLKVQDADPQRAKNLATAVAQQLQARYEDLRETKAQSVIGELVNAVRVAQADLDESTKALSALESQVGADLSELRILNELPSGDSDLHRVSTELESELRTYRAAQKANEELVLLLTNAQDDPGRILASPSRLLESQPGLKRLKDGLVDAQLKTSTLLGAMSPAHPLVRAAQAAEQEVSQHLHDEIAIAIKGLQVDLKLTAARVNSLEEQRSGVQGRLTRLAAMRAQYANLVAANRNRGETLKTAQLDLAEARASQASAKTASLISVIDQPDTGSRPLGPGRALIVLGGLLGGLFTGLGIVLLTVSPAKAAPQSTVSTLPTTSNGSHHGSTPLSTGLSFRQALQKLSAPPAWN